MGRGGCREGGREGERLGVREIDGREYNIISAIDLNG